MAFKEYDHKPGFLDIEFRNIIGKSRTQKFLSEVAESNTPAEIIRY